MKKIEAVTCIKFEERSKNQHKEMTQNKALYTFTSPKKYFESLKDNIEFISGSECSSKAGRQNGIQYIRLHPLCAQEYLLVHEVCM